MMCTNCLRDVNAVYRTTPLGCEDAGWMCEPCKRQQATGNDIDQEILDFVKLFSPPTNEQEHQ